MAQETSDMNEPVLHPAPAEGFGAALKRAREAQGISIGDMAARSRLSVQQVRALESERTAELPEPVYVRAFIRGVASVLGLEPDPLVADYTARYGAASVGVLPDHDPAKETVVRASGRRTGLKAAVVAIAAVLVCAAGWYAWSSMSDGAETQPAAETPVVDVDKLAEGIAAEIAVSGRGPVIAEEKAGGPGANAIEVRGSYGTAIEHPELDSAYNIWKASDLLNTTKIGPGETWSMKEALGTLGEEDGWKLANELIGQKIEKVPGGGLNHLASTVYAAALTAGLEIEEHTSRPWPADYIDAGLDADIFSEGADLALRNASDHPVYLVIECDAEGKSLTVSFLGQPFEDGLERQVESETVTENGDLGGVTAEVSLKKGGVTETLFEVDYQADGTSR